MIPVALRKATFHLRGSSLCSACFGGSWRGGKPSCIPKPTALSRPGSVNPHPRPAIGLRSHRIFPETKERRGGSSKALRTIGAIAAGPSLSSAEVTSLQFDVMPACPRRSWECLHDAVSTTVGHRHCATRPVPFDVSRSPSRLRDPAGSQISRKSTALC